MAQKITTRINQKEYVFNAELEDFALEKIREGAGLTGTKLVCGSGACGACTILVDGQPQCACLMPAVQMEGKSIETVEGHQDQDAKGEMHPVQKAFMVHDALQCGYCTPGFINAGIAFYTKWKKERGNKQPSREEIAEGLAGNLCRCGAYQGIYDAIQAACTGEFDGAGIPKYYRNEAPEKVQGLAAYTTDLHLEGQLVGKIFRSPHAHARLKSLDTTAAEKMPGVKALIRIKEDEVARYDGEPIVALAAETEAQARAALKKIKAEWEPLNFVTSIADARHPKAPLVYPDGTKGLPNASEGPRFPGKWDRNLRKVTFSLNSSKKGRAKRMLRSQENAEQTLYSAVFKTPAQLHTCLEPHAALADWKPDKLTLYASTQSVYFLAKEIAKHYKLKEEQVEVKAWYIGGAFGSKLTFHTAARVAIELSRKAGAPVALVYDRAEEMTDAGFRPPSEIELDLACNPDGSKPGYVMTAYNNGGVSTGSMTAEISGLNYGKGLARKLIDFDVVSNQGPASAFRAPGGPASNFALEQGVDQLAHQLGMDPIAFRRKWEEGEEYQSLFQWIEKLPAWQERKEPEGKSERFRKGIGVATAGWYHFYMPTAEVEVEAGKEGLVVRCSVQDMGQGARSVLTQAVAEVFEVLPSEVRAEIGTSDLPIGPTSGGSRTTPSIYPAAKEAAQKVKDRIKKEGYGSWKDLAGAETPIKVKVKRGRNKGFNPLEMIKLSQGLVMGRHKGLAAYVVETEVDTLLGKVRVPRVWGAVRVGKVAVPTLALSQCYGGVIQGLGHALYEDKSLCGKTGRVLSRGLEDYRIPGIGDIPEMSIDFIEEGFDYAKERGIGLAEVCTVPVMAAIANSIFNATGWRPLEAPILPERVLQGLSV